MALTRPITLTRGFVGVWREVLRELPVLGRPFCLELFGEPYFTDCGLTPEGFQVFLPGRTPSPVFLVSPVRMQVYSPDMAQVGQVFDSVAAELGRLSDGRVGLEFSAIGLNSEYEWLDLPKPAHEWIGNLALNERLREVDRRGFVTASDIRIAMAPYGKDTLYNLTIQPRAGKENAAYISVNDHREWGEGEKLTGDRIVTLLVQSEQSVQELFEVLLKKGSHA